MIVRVVFVKNDFVVFELEFVWDYFLNFVGILVYVEDVVVVGVVKVVVMFLVGNFVVIGSIWQCDGDELVVVCELFDVVVDCCDVEFWNVVGGEVEVFGG